MTVKKTTRKGFNFFRSYYDVYNELGDKDKIAFIDALLDKQFLNIDPVDLKGMANFAYISQTNSIDGQVKGYNDKMKKLNKPLIGINITPTDGGQLPPTEQEEGKGKGKLQGKEKEIDEKKFVFRKSLIDYGFDKELVEDWLKARKLKRLPNTQTALKSFIIEIEKCNQPINEVLKIIVESGWAGFKRKWLDMDNGVETKTEKIQL